MLEIIILMNWIKRNHYPQKIYFYIDFILHLCEYTHYIISLYYNKITTIQLEEVSII